MLLFLREYIFYYKYAFIDNLFILAALFNHVPAVTIHSPKNRHAEQG